MKKIALITSFCNTKEKLKVLYDNIKTIKDLGLEIFVTARNSAEVFDLTITVNP